MNEFVRTVREGFWRLYDWCMANKRLALAAGAGIMVLIILLSIVCCAPKAVDEGVDMEHGTEWTYYADGTLSFTGEGEIVGLSTVYAEDGTVTAEQPEWYAYRDQITTVEVGKDITYVGMDSFVEFGALTTVIVRGETTELDIECIRYETAEGWDHYQTITIYGMEGSPAQSFADFSGFKYRPL